MNNTAVCKKITSRGEATSNIKTSSLQLVMLVWWTYIYQCSPFCPIHLCWLQKVSIQWWLHLCNRNHSYLYSSYVQRCSSWLLLLHKRLTKQSKGYYTLQTITEQGGMTPLLSLMWYVFIMLFTKNLANKYTMEFPTTVGTIVLSRVHNIIEGEYPTSV